MRPTDLGGVPSFLLPTGRDRVQIIPFICHIPKCAVTRCGQLWLASAPPSSWTLGGQPNWGRPIPSVKHESVSSNALDTSSDAPPLSSPLSIRLPPLSSPNTLRHTLRYHPTLKGIINIRHPILPVRCPLFALQPSPRSRQSTRKSLLGGSHPHGVALASSTLCVLMCLTSIFIVWKPRVGTRWLPSRS